MKKLFLVLSMICLSFGVFAQTEAGRSSFGTTLGYAFDTEQAAVGWDYRYCLTDEVRFNPGLTYFIKNHGLSAWVIDVNAHYVIKLNRMFGFYPLGGLSLSFWDREGPLDGFTRFGMNVGLGGEVYATPVLSIGMEAKYNVIKDYDQAIIALRAAYCF